MAAAAVVAETATKPSDEKENIQATSLVAFFFYWTGHCAGKVSSRFPAFSSNTAHCWSVCPGQTTGGGHWARGDSRFTGLCDKVGQVAWFIAVVGDDVDEGPRRGAVRMDGSVTDLGQL